VLKYVPLLEQAFHRRKRPVGVSWRLDETYVRIKGKWKYLYRAVDKAGDTVDFLLTAKRDRRAALRFLHKAIGRHGAPEKITIDKSGANAAAIESYNKEHEADIEIRQVKYLTDIFDKPFSRAVLIFVSHGRPRGEERVLGMRAQPRALTTSVSRLRRPCTVRAWSANW
jgi:putative transposase